MLAEHSLVAWTLLSIGLVLIPGPDSMLVVGHSARHGFWQGMKANAGIQLGGVWYMALCGFGFLSILNAVPSIFMIVKTAGALYLAYMGVQLIRGALKTPEPSAPIAVMGNPVLQGFLSTVLNPKVAIFFLAALPQFVGTGPEAPARGAMLIAFPYVIGFCWLTFVAAIAQHARKSVGQSSAMRWFEGVLGTAFIGLAGRLALARNA